MKHPERRIADMLQSDHEDTRRQAVETARCLGGEVHETTEKFVTRMGCDLRASEHRRFFQRNAARTAAALIRINNRREERPFDELIRILFMAGNLTTKESAWTEGERDGIYYYAPFAWSLTYTRLAWMISVNRGRIPHIDAWCRCWMLMMMGGSHRAKALRMARHLLTGEMPP